MSYLTTVRCGVTKLPNEIGVVVVVSDVVVVVVLSSALSTYAWNQVNEPNGVSNHVPVSSASLVV
jgi:hypothetical protein